VLERIYATGVFGFADGTEPLLFHRALYLLPSAKICQRGGNRVIVRDLVPLVSHAHGSGYLVNLDRKTQASRDLANDFFGGRMDDVEVCRPGREYAKTHDGGAQPSKTNQDLLHEWTWEKPREADDAISQGDCAETSQDGDAGFYL
jgi:hypothetical protein